MSCCHFRDTGSHKAPLRPLRTRRYTPLDTYHVFHTCHKCLQPSKQYTSPATMGCTPVFIVTRHYIITWPHFSFYDIISMTTSPHDTTFCTGWHHFSGVWTHFVIFWHHCFRGMTPLPWQQHSMTSFCTAQPQLSPTFSLLADVSQHHSLV